VTTEAAGSAAADSAAPPAQPAPPASRLRWGVLVVAALGLVAFVLSLPEPWTRTLGSIGLQSITPLRSGVFDFGLWGYGYVLAAAVTGGLLLAAVVGPVTHRGRLALLALRSTPLLVGALVAVTIQIRLHEVGVRADLADRVWRAHESKQSTFLLLSTDGLQLGTFAVGLLTVGALVIGSARFREPRVLAGFSAAAFAVALATPVRSVWITDAYSLRYHYEFIVSQGLSGYLTLAAAVALVALVCSAATMRLPGRFLPLWCAAVVLLVVALLWVFSQLPPSSASDPDADVDTAVGSAEFLIYLATCGLLASAIRIAVLWRRAAQGRGAPLPLPVAPGVEEWPLGPLATNARPRWNQRRVLVVAVIVATVAAALSAALTEDEAELQAAPCREMELALNQLGEDLKQALVEQGSANKAAARELRDQALQKASATIRATAFRTRSRALIKAANHAADGIAQQVTPEEFTMRVAALLRTFGGECGRLSAR